MINLNPHNHMKRSTALLAVFFSALLCAVCTLVLQPNAARAQDQGTSDPIEAVVAFTNAIVIDGTGAPPMSDATVVVEGDRIACVGACPLPSNAEVIDARGRYIIPGLIDSNVNLARYPYGKDRREVVERVLEAALRRGVTSVRDLGGDARELALLARDAAVGEIPSPDMHYAALFAGPSFYASYPRVQTGARGGVAGEVPWARAVTEETDLRQAVAEAKGTGASAVLLFADLSPSLVRWITDEAHRQGLQVWANAAVHPAGPRDVIGAGVDAVSGISNLYTALFPQMPRSFAERREHGLGGLTPADLDASRPPIPSLMQKMREQGTVFSPVVWRPAFAVDDSEEVPRWLDLFCGYAIAAKEAGVPTSVGTSEGHQIQVVEATELLVDGCGFTPLEAIRAATLHGAMAIGIEETHGSIEVGKRADLVVLGSDPTQDIGNLGDVVFVLKGGTVHTP